MNTAVIGIALGSGVGLVLGLTGAGGSVLAVPMLMAGFGWSLSRAAPVALIAVASSALLGSWLAWRGGFVRYRAAALMGLAGALCSPLGLHLAHRLPDEWLMLLFAAVMVVVAARMLRQARRRPAEARVVWAEVTGGGPLLRLNPDTGRLVWTPLTALVIGGIGALTGVLSGLLGVGGGFVIVPAVRAVTPLSIHSAVGTSLMTIAVVAAGTVFAASFGHGGLPWAQALPFAAGALAGMGLGRALAPRIAGVRLEEGFAILMLIVAAGLAGRGVHAW